ncbi:MAG: exopolyphosphatase [Bacteroidota bacterium]
MRIAVLDLGTNTFLLLIGEAAAGMPRILYEERTYVNLGAGSLQQGMLTPEAQARAISTLRDFKQQISVHQVAHTRAVATSALRSVSNGRAFVQQVKEQIGIDVQIISGDEEAVLIYEGIKKAISLNEKSVLIMDIGGGSVEFIIGNHTGIQWQQSFDMGGQRLWDAFHNSNTSITPEQLVQLNVYADRQLQTLWEAVTRYAPTLLIGASGTFQSLANIHSQRIDIPLAVRATAYDLPLASFKAIYEDIRYRSREERLLVPGLSTKRVDFIVVALTLIHKVLQRTGLSRITYSTYSLKMGLLWQELERLSSKASNLPRA